MATILQYDERERLKRLADTGSERDVRTALRNAAPDPATGALFDRLPLPAAREALVGVALWHRFVEFNRRQRIGLAQYLAQWAWWIEPEGRVGKYEREGPNALQAFISRPNRPMLPRGISY